MGTRNSDRAGKSRVVFVGNIPYDATEDQLRDIFSEIGPVSNFRIVTDRETGKLKGFGFCEYRDYSTATSAVRNLNGYELSSRQLRVDFAEDSKDKPPPSSSGRERESRRDHDRDSSTWVRDADGPARRGRDDRRDADEKREDVKMDTGTVAPASLGPQELITNALSTLSQQQLLEFLTQTKELVLSNPEQTQMLLANNPSLAHTLVQILTALGLLNANAVQSAPVKMETQPTSAPIMPPPVPVMPSVAPPIAQVQSQAAIMQQLLSLSDDQLAQLPPEYKAQIDTLKSQMRM